MKYLLRFLLALVISALLVVTYGNIEAVWKEHSRVGRVENMTSQSNDRNRIRSDALELKIYEPQLIGISIPDKQSGVNVPVKFTVSLTNNTKAPIPFIDQDTLIPEIIGSDGQALHRKEPINRKVGSREYRGTLVGVGDERFTSVDGRLSWQNNLLQLILHRATYLESPIDLDKSWSFDTVRPGEYQLRFTYENPTGTTLYADPLTFLQTRQETRIEVTGRGELATPFVNLRLLEPVGDNKNAVEVDGIRFETFIPESLLTVPKNKRKAGNSVQIGLRITNNTPTPFYFSFYSTYTPDLVRPDGQVKRGEYNTDWMRGPEESDFLLVPPEKSTTFFPSITLSWKNPDKFSLLVYSGFGGWCHFGELKPGIYQLRFRYENMNDTIQKKTLAGESIESLPIEKVGTGRVDTPFVEFRIAQP